MTDTAQPAPEAPEKHPDHGAPAKPQIVRDEKGRIVKGVAQDVNKNGTAGRPTDYKPEYCEQIIEFFSVEPFQTIELITTDKRTGRKYANQELQGARFPTLERFASNVGVHVDTLADWAARHPDFDRAVRECKQMQKDLLVTNGLLGLYNGGFAQFVARNFTDMEDRKKLDIDMPQPLLGGSTVLKKEAPADADDEA